MIRSEIKRGTKGDFQAVQYDPQSGPILGTIMFFHGIGGCGTDLTLVDNEWFPAQLKSGAMNIPYVVVCPQLPKRLNPDGTYMGWYKNDYNPSISYGKSLGNKNILTGLSLGSMSFDPMLSDNPGVFDFAMSCAGKSDTFSWMSIPSQETAAMPELMRIPTVFYYGTADTQIPGGYASMLALSNTLKSKGADNTWMPFANRKHDIWPDSFKDFLNNWLPSKIGTAPAQLVNDLVVSWSLVNGVLVGITQSGKTVSVTDIQVK